MESKESGSDRLGALRNSVALLDAKCVRSALDSLDIGYLRRNVLKENSDLIHLLVKTESQSSTSTFNNHQKIMILYMLVDAGADVNAKFLQDCENKDHVTPLWLAMKTGNVSVAQVLLQCGADTNQFYKNKTLWDWVINYSSDQNERCLWFKNVEEFQNLFLKFGKGLGSAIQKMELESVRMSINFCYRTDISVNDRKLIDLVTETGNDDITRIITRATPYLALAHHILAQDIAAVRNWYETEPANLSSVPLFYFGPYGNVPLIHFAIQYQNVDLIKLLLSKGHRVTARTSYEDTEEMPVFFSGLQPDMPVEGVRVMLDNLDSCDEKKELHRLLWLDSNVLHVALRRRCSLDVTRLLLEFGGPRLLCQRNASNQTARDLAESMQLLAHVELIDHVVTQWLTSNQVDAVLHRSLLALYSYDLTKIFEKETLRHKTDELEDYKSEFYRLQEQLEELYNAVIENDIEKSRKLFYFTSPVLGRHHLPLESRLAGDGLPLLHIAVLCRFEDLVQVMLEDVDSGQDVNAVRDQFGRTALHYAYASVNSFNITRLLINAGCTEAVFDMNGRRPDDYKEMQGTPEMEHFLQCLRTQDYRSLLMDPLEPSLVAYRRKVQWEWRVEAYRKNKSSFVACRGTSLQNGSHFRHPLNNQPIWCNVL